MKFFICPKCKTEYSYEDGTVALLLENNQAPKCEGDGEILQSVTKQELDAIFKTRLEEAKKEELDASVLTKATKIRITKEEGKTFVEFDGQKLLITGPVTFRTNKGEVSITI